MTAEDIIAEALPAHVGDETMVESIAVSLAAVLRDAGLLADSPGHDDCVPRAVFNDQVSAVFRDARDAGFERADRAEAERDRLREAWEELLADAERVADEPEIGLDARRTAFTERYQTALDIVSRARAALSADADADAEPSRAEGDEQPCTHWPGEHSPNDWRVCVECGAWARLDREATP